MALVGAASLSGTGPMASADTTTTSSSTSAPTTTTTTVPGQTTSPPSSTTTSLPTTTLPPTTTTTIPAQEVLAEALVAVEAERGVKWTYVEAAGSESFTEAVHAGEVDGTMTDTLHLAHSGTVKFALHNKLYFRGTAYGLEQDLGFKPKYGSQEAGHWISVSSSNSTFLVQRAIMTMAAVAGLLDLQGAKVTVEPQTTVRGVAAVPVQESGTESGTKISQTVYIKATGAHLPVELIREFDGIEGVITYSDWGTPPDATVPASPRAFKSTWVSNP